MATGQPKPVGVRERMRQGLSPIFDQAVLSSFFDFKRQHWFEPLLKTHTAWCVALVEREIIPRADGARILRALAELEATGTSGLEPYDHNLEYFYLHVERFLSDRAGEEVVGNLNIGRTRPEPLTRLMLRDMLLDVIDAVLALRGQVLAMAGQHAHTVMPGYTHMQHAQPTTVGHYLGAMADVLERDTDRLLAAYGRTNRSSMGCGALAGASYPIDRDRVGELLGFDGLVPNTFDCVASADHKLEALAALSNMMISLSRLAQDFHLWCTTEFAMLEIGDDFANISSLMPQKKNTLVFEYIRARAASVTADLQSASLMVHNTCFQDTEDICIDVEFPVAHAVERTLDAVRLFTGVLTSLRVRPDRMLELANAGFSTASELAYAIQRRTGLSYRTAHRVVARTVLLAVERGLPPSEVTPALVDEAAGETIGRSLQLKADLVRSALDAASFVRAIQVTGGPQPAEVERLLSEASRTLQAAAQDQARRRERVAEADRKRKEVAERLMPATV